MLTLDSVFMTSSNFGARYFSLFLQIFVFAMNGTLYACNTSLPDNFEDLGGLANMSRDLIVDSPAPGQEGSGPGLHQLCGKCCFYLDSVHVPNPRRTLLQACNWLLYRIAMHSGDLCIHTEDPPREAE